jgi:antitoxin (DNA-binding transcriptional repressor) of toxin-antitoxin stability system
MGRLPGDTRTLTQRMHDAAYELLTVDAHGGQSAVPAVGADGEPVTLTVGGMQVALIMPVSVALGGDRELAEIPGLGPVLPSTARELLAHADTVQRITVDASTGQVLTVDTPVPGPARLHEPDAEQQPHEDPAPASPEPTDHAEPGEPSAPEPDTESRTADAADPQISSTLAPPEPQPSLLPHPGPDATPPTGLEPDKTSAVPEPVRVLLERLTSAPVEIRDLSSQAYRPPDRLRRHAERRDRTCTFPGCTVPGERCDIDHREPWPHGPTTDTNCHCLCRRHHRAKQAYFTIELDPDTGDTIWTTPVGPQYRRPPPTY